MNKLFLFIFFSSLFQFSFSQTPSVTKEYIPGELIVQLNENININSSLVQLDEALGFKAKEELSPIMRAWLVSFDATAIEHEEAKRLIKNLNAFSIVQNNHKVELRSTIPNDTEFNVQWHHQNTGQSNGTVDADIDSDEAWDITTGGTTATGDEIVACIIEGVDMTHTDLVNNRWQNPNEIAGNGVDDDNNGYIDDIYGWNITGNNGNVATGAHGTNVAGMIGARGNNSTGVAGANWDVKIMVVSGYNVNSESNIISCYNYPLVQRKLYNETNGARGAFVVVTNASWGIDNGDPDDVPLWCQFYDTLGYYGIVSCAATTNSNLNVDVAGDIPTACSSDYMIGVGRSDRNDDFAGGYGLNTIDLAAPGISVRTTSGTSSYTTTTGTSFASPLTAGVVALLYSIPCTDFMAIVNADPKLGADLVRQALLQGVDPKPSLANFFITGGRLNAKNSIDILMNTTCNGAFCLPPSVYVAVNNSTTETQVSWVTAPGADSYNFYFRTHGSGNWNSQPLSDTVVVLTGLLECTSYEYYLESVCDGSASDAGTINTFTTGCGNCTDLPYCTSRSLDNTENLLSILQPSVIANNYAFQAPSSWGGNLNNTYIYGQLVVADDGTAADSLGCGTFVNSNAMSGNIALIFRGSCQFGTKALNAQNAGAAAVIIVNNTGGNATMNMSAGNDGGSVNIPVVMISQNNGTIINNELNSGSNVSALLGVKNDWIESFELSGNTNNSGDDAGYGAYLGFGPLNISRSQTYSVAITPGFSNAAYPVYHRVWIDLDQDASFEANELLFDQGSSSGSPATGTITIPPDAATGTTRMRVLMSFDGPGQGTLPDVCDLFNWGEVEDYCVEISDITDIPSSKETSFIVYPNPGSGSFTVTFSEKNMKGELEIHNVLGEVLKTIQVQGQTSVNINSHWAPGNYFLVLKTDYNRSVKKLVVIR